MTKTLLLIVLSSVAFGINAQQSNSGQAKPPAPTQNQQPQMQAQMQQMEGRMAEMRALMERIQKTEDPAERQRLLDEHARSMQQGMMMMGQMMHGPGGGQGPQCAQNDTQCQMQRMQGQQQMMGQQMGMMQSMMEQMMGQMMGMMQQGAKPEAKPEAKSGDKDQQDHEAHHK